MDSEYDPETRRSRTWVWTVLGLLVAFVCGIAAMGYAVTHDPRTTQLLHLETSEQAAAEQIRAGRIAARQQQERDAAAVKAAKAPQTIESDIATRLTTIEGKVDDIQAQATEATGDASRAEGLLVAFAARRALDRGVELGYIEGLLHQRFGNSQPQAVATIISAARQPVTLADLQNGLDAVAPTLAAGGTPRQGWWQTFRQELAGMVVVRRAGEPSTQPADRVARAQRMVEAGQIDAALAEIARLGDHKAADGWIVAARRYLAGRGALDQIETAALLDPATSSGPPMPPPAASPSVTPVHPATAKATD